jgi:hypothetical protein
MRPQFTFISFSENLVKSYPDECVLFNADVAIVLMMQ